MNSYIKNPKILLLKCSIEYLYREETKFTCIDPIVLQVSLSPSTRGRRLVTCMFYMELHQVTRDTMEIPSA